MSRKNLFVGANINQFSGVCGSTALMLVSKNGHLSVCKDLLDMGADVNRINPSGNTALMGAAETGSFSVCEELIRYQSFLQKFPPYWD